MILSFGSRLILVCFRHYTWVCWEVWSNTVLTNCIIFTKGLLSYFTGIVELHNEFQIFIAWFHPIKAARNQKMFLNIYITMRFEILMVMNIWILFFWSMLLCRLVGKYQCFREMYCLWLLPWRTTLTSAVVFWSERHGVKTGPCNLLCVQITRLQRGLILCWTQSNIRNNL
jgi:hypothetical protein